LVLLIILLSQVAVQVVEISVAVVAQVDFAQQLQQQAVVVLLNPQ